MESKSCSLLFLKVFKGKIVVTGVDNSKLKSVESYDYYANKWTHLPDMIEKRSSHVQLAWLISFLLSVDIIY